MINNCLPEKFIEKLSVLIPEKSKRDQVLASFSQEKKTAIRINTLNASVKEILVLFEEEQIQFEQSDIAKEALIILNKTSRELTEMAAYKEGKIYIQSLSSMIPALVLDPQKDEKILDMAAAPGSKTSQIAALMNNTGELVANDIDRNRLFRLRSVLAQLNVTNTKVISIPGQRLWEQYKEYFDRVLLDAPCSMEGRFNCDDPISIAHWSQKKVKNLAKLQKWLLRSAISATKVGGTIVYSTCTMSPEENEEIVEWILEKEKGTIQHTLSKRILPDSYMEAFFIASFLKINTSFRQRE